MKLSMLLWLTSLMPQPVADQACLATTVYLEARSEPTIGQLAVAEVALRRLDRGHYGNTVCDHHHTWLLRDHQPRCFREGVESRRKVDPQLAAAGRTAPHAGAACRSLRNNGHRTILVAQSPQHHDWRTCVLRRELIRCRSS
jgi:hypothetical protein